MEETARQLNQVSTNKSYSMITLVLFWCGLVVVSGLYITIPLVNLFSNSFHVSLSQATWVSSAFSLFYAMSFLIFGPLLERIGSKRVMLIGLISLSIVTPIIGLMNSLPFIILTRGIQGMAAAIVPLSMLAYAAEMFPIAKRVTTIGFISSGFLMAGIAGQVMSGVISQTLGWRYVFYILGAVYFMTMLIVVFLTPQSHETRKTTPLLTLYISMGKLLTRRSLILCYLITVMLLLSFVGMYTALGSYLSHSPYHLNNQNILYIRSAGILGMLLSPFAGRLVSRFGSTKVLNGGLFLAVIGLAFIGLGTNLIFMIAMSVIFVSGIAICVPTLISLVGQLGGAYRGAAVSLYSFILFIGATLGPVITIHLLSTGSYILTFETLAMLLGIGWVVSFFIKLKSE
ncbi:MFS transporter [Terrilactibacillus laevilacticus]|uniref:MFS transporter n=1 Tax=Terrilactibacillus laevilacticus TaxID=1380157 RepID=A0ABW5PMW3_9BACI|nr:MFS transporter [Terrilactibacillus laevilacticus]